MKQYFEYREHGVKGYVIIPIYKEFSESMIRGSYGLLPCRITGLSWPQYLRYCMQHGAHVYGKHSKYPTAVWDEPNMEFLNMLNQRANELAKVINFKELNL